MLTRFHSARGTIGTRNNGPLVAFCEVYFFIPPVIFNLFPAQEGRGGHGGFRAQTFMALKVLSVNFFLEILV